MCIHITYIYIHNLYIANCQVWCFMSFQPTQIHRTYSPHQFLQPDEAFFGEAALPQWLSTLPDRFQRSPCALWSVGFSCAGNDIVERICIILSVFYQYIIIFVYHMHQKGKSCYQYHLKHCCICTYTRIIIIGSFSHCISTGFISHFFCLWYPHLNLPSGNLTWLLKMTVEILDFYEKWWIFPQLYSITGG